MLEKAINRILAMASIEKLSFDGRDYTSGNIVPVKEPQLPVLEVNTLQGLVDYLRSGFDSRAIGKFYTADNMPTDFGVEGMPDRPYPPLQVALHIESPHLVTAFLPVGGQWKVRQVAVKAVWNQTRFPFSAWLSQEEFVIKMQAMFLPSASWQPVMDIAAKIVCEDKAELTDDGIAQAVTVSRGVRKESGIILPNPVQLKPVRTFTEVDQPESAFVFRMRSDPVALSLHEADMGAWEMAAKQNIKAFLEKELPGVPVFM